MVPEQSHEPDYLIRVLERAGRVLNLISRAPAQSTLSWLSEQTGLGKPTVFRLVKNLEYLDLVEASPDRKTYRLGPHCAVLGQSYLEQVDVLSAAKSALLKLRDATSETTHLGVLDRMAQVVYLDKLEGTHAVGIMMSRVGRTAPAYCTGVGKIVLAYAGDDVVERVFANGELTQFTDATITDREGFTAHLAAIRERGYSLDLEEHERGVRCVAVPVRDSAGAVLAGISVTGPAARMSIERLEGDLLRHAQEAAHEASRRLGWSGSLTA